MPRIDEGLEGWPKVLLWNTIWGAGVLFLLLAWNVLAREELNIALNPALFAWVLAVFNGFLILTPLTKRLWGNSYCAGHDELITGMGVFACDLALALLVWGVVWGWNAVVKESFLLDQSLRFFLLGGFLAGVNFLWAAYLRRNS